MEKTMWKYYANEHARIAQPNDKHREKEVEWNGLYSEKKYQNINETISSGRFFVVKC